MTKSLKVPTALAAGGVAVVTGAASGIGRAAARRFFELGLKVVLADKAAAPLDRVAAELVAGAPERANEVLAVPTDVAVHDEMLVLKRTVEGRFGGVSVLLNNAGIGANPGLPWQHSSAWKALLDVNLWGIVHSVEAFVPDMLAGEAVGLVINTGSKQGITSPPGNAAYNLSKAAVKSYTESLAHELRERCGDRIQVALLIPGFTFTGMSAVREKPRAAWYPEQVIEFMLRRLAAGDFYVLCPDNEVDRAIDERRIRWSAEDIIFNRPALSRWHPQFREAFARHMSED